MCPDREPPTAQISPKTCTRLTDEEWAQELVTATPEDVPWMRDLVVR